MNFINLNRQYQQIKAGVQDRLDAVLEHGQYIMGPEVSELEQALACYAAADQCIAVSSGTDALLIALMALGVQAGDEVITTPFTFVATAEAIVLLGAKPVYVDIDSKTFNLDPALIEAKITAKTKAIIPVSLYGQCADMDAINAIAQRHSIAVIEDAAQSFGATYKSRPSAGLSTIATTSFYPSKPLGAYGDGGACFTSDAELAEKMRQIRVHGQSGQYEYSRLGVNGRLDSMQAAVLLEKLAIFPQTIQARQQIAANYTEAFLAAGFQGVPMIEAYNQSAYAQYTVVVNHREQVKAAMDKAGIPTMVFYPVPLHKQPPVGDSEASCPVSEAMSTQVLSLPMCPYMTEQEQNDVIETFIAIAC